MAQKKPFKVKGKRIVTPKGTAMWCKINEPDYAFNDKGTLSTNLMLDLEAPEVKAFIADLEALRDTALSEIQNGEGDMQLKPAVIKQINVAEVFKEEEDEDGESTGRIYITAKLNNVDDKEKGKDYIKVIDANKKAIAREDVPDVGNGSVIRCKVYANPYYMASTKTVGVSLIWEMMQLINLEEYAGDDEGFDEEEGYVVPAKDSDGLEEKDNNGDF